MAVAEVTFKRQFPQVHCTVHKHHTSNHRVARLATHKKASYRRRGQSTRLVTSGLLCRNIKLGRAAGIWLALHLRPCDQDAKAVHVFQMPSLEDLDNKMAVVQLVAAH